MTTIPRFHLVELEDLPWFPKLLRDYATDYLQFAERMFGLHRPVLPILRSLIDTTGCHRLVDLCSGGTGPIVPIVEALRAEGVAVSALLTDRYPNIPAFARACATSSGAIDFCADAVDARVGPAGEVGIRTVFNAIHHFRPEDVRAVIRGAVTAGQPIGIFEIPERTVPVVLQTFLAPLMVILATPFIRPFAWRRLLLTYLLPLVPITCLWDGVVSQLRAYTAEELETLARSVSDDYVWTSGSATVERLPARLTYLVGRPRGSRRGREW